MYGILKYQIPPIHKVRIITATVPIFSVELTIISPDTFLGTHVGRTKHETPKCRWVGRYPRVSGGPLALKPLIH